MTVLTLVRRWWFEIVTLLATCAIIGWILSPFFVNAWNTPAARRQLVVFASELKQGLSQADVRERFAAVPRDLLKLREVDPTLTLVETPHRIGADDWLARLDFTDGRLSSIRIHTADGVNDKPAGSPPDVGTPPARRR